MPHYFRKRESRMETVQSGYISGGIKHDSDASYIPLVRDDVLHQKKAYWIGRRLQDILFAGLAFVILLPLMLVIALLIWLDDPHGSPIFVQERIGRDGKPFRFYKFRSMVVNAELELEGLMGLNEKDGPMFKIKDDPRITRIGRFIRKTSIDELPQLLNILKGNMSIVGPRPCLPREYVQFNEYQKQKTYVQPGLTCYWQIQKNRDSISFDEWIDLDIQYIKERSFLTDWKIIFKTFAAVFTCQGE